MKWLEENISDIASIGDGAHASLRRLETGVPYITAKNITTDGIEYSSISYISESTYAKHFSNSGTALTTPIEGDVLYSIIGSIGGVYIMKDERIGISSSIAIFRANPNIILSQYLYYFIKSSLFNAQVQAIRGGVAQSFLSLGKLGTIKIKYPNNLEYQKKIADILSTYDSLIANNQKQIKLLEEAAQRLYKEWFIDLHFPGHADCKIVDGVPEGWTKQKIADIAETVGGGTPSTKVDDYYRDGNILWVTPTDITQNNSLYVKDTARKITNDGLIHSSAKMLPPYTILMTSRASVGYFGFCDKEVCTNQGFISSIPKRENIRSYLLYNLMSRVEEIRGLAGGATYLEISKSNFRNMDIIIPFEDVLTDFENIIKPIMQQIIHLTRTIHLTKEARDRLLPKLMSGEIEL